MSARYIAVPTSASEEREALLDEDQSTPSVHIQPYIPVRRRTECFDISALLLIAMLFFVGVGIFVGYRLVYHAKKTPVESTPPPKSNEWVNSYKHVASESAIRLVDINGDGADDIIFGMAQFSDDAKTVSQSSYCSQYKDGCLGNLIAINGLDSSLLWTLPTLNEVFGLNCGNIDINRDGKADCVGGGRRGTYVAFDPRLGKLLWAAQTGAESFIDLHWNIYTPLVVDDLNKDGVAEVILAHGGNPDFPPENKSRDPGRLLIMDGETGNIIGNYINIPDGKETYCSPVLHRDRNGTNYILIGSGGESVAGSLFVTRLHDLLANARNQPISSQGIRQLAHVKGGFHQMFSGESKGVMVPAVLADITEDGVDDIIISSFDGIISAYNGESFSAIWTQHLPGLESYTTPGVGYFNPDSQLDFMMHWNLGTWPDYTASTIVVHSGLDGSALWTYNTSRFSMTSDLVLRTNHKNDLFVVRIQGRAGKPLDYGMGVIHGIDPQRKLLSTNTTQQTKVKRESPIPCTETDLDILATEILIFDWETRLAPRRAFRRDVDKFRYDTNHIPPSRLESYGYSETTAVGEGEGVQKCVVMQQAARTTGAIGDLNADGLLDLAISFNSQGVLTDSHGNYVREEASMDLVRIDIQKNLNNYPVLSDMSSAGSSKGTSKTRPEDILPIKQQIWTAYMGGDGTSTYRNNA